MPRGLPLQAQYEAAMAGLQEGDLGLISKVLTDPDAVTLDEHRTFAERMGIKSSWLKATVNVVTDPTILAAFLLSRSFPTASYLKGTIPLRYIGSANEFSGLSSMFRTVEGFFRGTNIPKLTALKMQREAEVLQVGNKIFDRLLARPAWKEEMPAVSLILEGRHPPGATPELYNLAGDIRGHMDELWGFLSRTVKVRGGFDGANITFASATPFRPGEAPRYLRDYLPHIPLLGTESIVEVSGREALAKFGKSKFAQAIQLRGENPGQVWTPTASDRLTSTFERYQRFMERVGAQVFNPRLFKRQRFGIPLQSAEGEGLFITDLNVVLQRYVHGVARTYALNAPLTEKEIALARTFVETPAGVRAIHPTNEPIMVQLINEGLKASGTPRIIRRPIAGTNKVDEFIDPKSVNAPTMGALRTLVREVSGKADESEALFGNAWNAIRMKVRNLVPFGRREQRMMEDAISSFERRAQDRNVTNRITSFFYATTLGLNPSSAFKNMMQPFLTTVPSIGMGPTLAGYKVLRQRLPNYFREFTHQQRLLAANPDINQLRRFNLAAERSFHNVFPELARAGIKADPRAFELSEAALISDPMTGTAKFRNREALYKFLLQPFTHVEMSNQIVTFFGGKQALRDALRRGEIDFPAMAGRTLSGRDMDDFLNFEAGTLVNATQFRPGPGSRTVLQTMIPAPFRMFTSFPIRLANHFADSTVRGALTDAQLRDASFLTRLTGGRNLGTIARTYAIGKALTTGLRDTLGVDIADAMGVTGPFTNVLSSGELFSPLPVSPLPSVVFHAASYAATRDIKRLQPVTLPVVGEVPLPRTLVPGGIAITRASRALRAYRPDLGGFVDENEKLMYQGDTFDLVLSMLGIPLEKERRMKDALEEVNVTRMRAREFRRKYAVAARNYDLDEQTRLEADFSQKFPEMGRLGISGHDLRRYREQARMTSVQRLLRSMGRRSRFLEADIYEHDPDLVVAGF